MKQLKFFELRDPADVLADELYAAGKCPVDPRETPCPMLGCRHHCYVTTESDMRGSVVQIVDRVLSAKYTCMHHLLEDHPNGMTVEQMMEQLHLQKQTVRDRLEEAAKSTVFAEIIEKIEDVLDTDDYLSGTQRVAALGELLQS